MIVPLSLLLLLLTSAPAQAAVVIAQQPVLVTARSPMVTTAPVVLPAQTDRITLRLRRPTTVSPLAWDDTSTVNVRIVITLDRERLVFGGRATGGIRRGGGTEAAVYALQATPTWGYFGARAGVPKRLGERSTTTYAVHVELIHVSGTVTSELSLDITESPAPAIRFSSSVAFDLATDAVESVGDGVVFLTHTASGSDRAAWAGVENPGDPESPGALGALTWVGAGTVSELYDEIYQTDHAHAGYSIIAPPTVPSLVTSTLTSVATLAHYLGVISMTGVDQTTPVGTAATANANDGGPATVTVASVGTDDLVVDSMNTSATPTTPAEQTERNNGTGGTPTFTMSQSTQPGADGGVMSRTLSTAAPWAIGAVAFKPSGAAPAAEAIVPQRTMTGVGL